MKAIDVSQMDSEALFASIQSEIAQRAAAMPTEEDAMVAMLQAFERLKELGWKEAMYCPKDGTLFWALEPGCSAAGVCQYLGTWPTGRYWTHSGGDLWPSRPALFKPMDHKSIHGIGNASPTAESR